MSVRPPPGFNSWETRKKKQPVSSQIGEYVVSYIKQLEKRVVELEDVIVGLNFGNGDPDELGRLLRMAGLED